MRRSGVHERGSTILLALWALLVLSVVVLGWARLIDGQMVLTAFANRKLEARAYAESGLQVAFHPLIKPYSPYLVYKAGKSTDDGYEATLMGEGGKLHLNWVLADSEDQDRLDLFNRFLERKGVKFQERNALIDCLLDWMDGDDLKRLNGAEAGDDYTPGNRPFLNLDEVALVRGSQALTSNPAWKDWFTLISNGPIDLRWADLDLLSSIPGVGEAKAQALIRLRRGGDGKDGTKDDHEFKSIQEVQQFLGLAPQQLEAISDLITVNDPTYRARSIGRSSGTEVRIEATFRKGEGRPQILRWQEY